MICEKSFYGSEMLVYNNSGFNTTLLKVFDGITLLDSKYNLNEF